MTVSEEDGRPTTLRAVVDELLEDGRHDWVPLHTLVWLSTGGDRSEAAKRRTFDVLRHLFSEGLMTPGDLGETGFEDWPGGTEDFLLRAAQDLERLAWKPMGDGFWLRLSCDG